MWGLTTDVGGGTRMELDLSRLTDCLVLCFGAGERDVIATLCEFCDVTSVALDVGANIGSVAIPAARYLKRGRVIAVEPSREMTRCLHKNALLSGVSNLEILQVAIGRSSGVASLTILHPGNPGSAYLDCLGEPGDAAVKVVTLSEAVPNLKRLDFVKLDVEGAEIAAIEGGADLLQRFRPVVVAEVNRKQLRLFGHSSEELIRLLRKLGYRCVIRENGTLRDLCEEDLDTDLAFNVIAIR
jgi:FkbM family methyltransferase